jgi:multicomponent Na+:H+ antiporter subunit E
MTESSTSAGTAGTRQGVAARAAAFAVVVAATWLLLSGLYKPLLLGLGAFSCALVVYIALRMRLLDESFFTLRLCARLPGYWVWLAQEIVKSSLEVTRAVLSPGLPISPTVAELEARSQHPLDVAILGNSITLTPGTVTIRIRDGRLIVHALTREGADNLLAGEMNRRVAALRGS